MRNDYFEIDFLDLCKDILRKWKTIVVCILICALFGGIYAALQSRNADADKNSSVKNLTAVMTKEEKKSVEDAAGVILSYRELYDNQKNYNDNSIYQNLNPYNLDTLRLVYYVDNHFQISYPTINETNNLSSIIYAYTIAFSNDSFYEKVAKENGVDNAVYIKELISTNYTGEDSSVFSVVVCGKDNEMLTKIGDCVKEAISEKQSEITKQYGPHDLVLISESCYKNSNSIMAETQQQNVERLTAISSGITSEIKLFSGDQLSYLNYLINDTEIAKPSPLRYVIAGAVIGMLISLIIVFVQYLTDGTLKTEKEITRNFKLNYFGGVGNDAEYVAALINSAADIDDCKKVAIICDETNEKINSIISQTEPETVVIPNLFSDKESFELFSSCDGAVLFEEKKVSKRRDITEKKIMCRNANIKLLGVVLK